MTGTTLNVYAIFNLKDQGIFARKHWFLFIFSFGEDKCKVKALIKLSRAKVSKLLP